MLLAEAQDAASKSFVEAYILPTWVGITILVVVVLYVVAASIWLVRRVRRRRAAKK